MPTNKEVVPNRPLAGHELREILIKDFGDMLIKDGMFSAHMAYKRVAYEISIKLQVDNVMFPEHKNKRTSRNPAKNAPPELQAVKAPPLEPEEGSNIETVGVKREQVVDSPNAARLEHGLPVTISKLDRQTGQISQQQVKYDNAGLETKEPKDTDISAQVQKDWGGA